MMNELSSKKSKKRNVLISIIVVLGIALAALVGYVFSPGESSNQNEKQETSLKAVDQSQKAELTDSHAWSAENIPMPHMQDHSKYVSNPDGILSEQIVDSINVVLGKLDDVLCIESAMVIVGHIADDNPMKMVSGIYGKYKVGKNDRGLVIVVGYLDHSYFIGTGKKLEKELSNSECDYLAQTYLIPGMKAEQPDSAMLNLARGVFDMMNSKKR